MAKNEDNELPKVQEPKPTQVETDLGKPAEFRNEEKHKHERPKFDVPDADLIAAKEDARLKAARAAFTADDDDNNDDDLSTLIDAFVTFAEGGKVSATVMAKLKSISARNGTKKDKKAKKK